MNKHTKKALFASILSLLLCVSMLVGTTFAWFTDSVTTGAQAGTFAGSGDGLKINNSFLKGTNAVTYDAYATDTYTEEWGGIGAVTGILQGNSNVNVEIVSGATVAMDYADITTKASKVDALTGYITANNGTVTNNGSIDVAVAVSTVDELKSALTSNAKNVSVTLADSVDFNLSTNVNLGGADTETVTIKGNGSDTVLNLSDAYRNYFNLANSNGTLYLEDLTLKHSQTGTHFYDYTVHFNCNVVANNVTVASPVLVSGVSVFNDCTLNVVTDVANRYGMFIMAGADVTFNGGSFSAPRGIKVADEDMSNPGLTKLNISDMTFTTTGTKSAVLVGSKGGAAITLNNVNIENVAADSVNVVWVDSDYASTYDIVTVVGGTKVQE